MTNEYTYGEDNLLTEFNINKERTVSYVYDDLNRLNDITISTTAPINIHYYYADSNRSGYSTTKIEEEIIDDTTYRYEYDAVGNITKISKVLSDDTAEPLYSYTYDKLNELTEVFDYTNLAKHTYTYNTAGNMTKEVNTYYNSSSVPVSSTTIKYAYSDSNWKDKLTNYNGQTITYDEIGNPLSYRDGMTMTWKNGRQLATLQDEDNDITYNYDSNSVRISKNVNGVEYTYTYLNGMLVYETRGEAKFYYSYDANGILYSISYTLTDDVDPLTYYCTHNSRGDIIGIYNYIGELRAKYEYDAWGNVLSITDADGNEITSATHVGNLNPFRYRGYYYDAETGLYYLMSRYYDPVTHRFLNADGYFQSGGDVLDYNMSAYCRNNPISFVDPTGTKCTIHDPYYVPTCLHCSPERRKFVSERSDWIAKVNPSYSATLEASYENTYLGIVTVSSYSKLSYTSDNSNANSSIEIDLPDLSSTIHNKVGITDLSYTMDTQYLSGLLGVSYNNVTNSCGFVYGKNSDGLCWDITVDYGDGWYYSTGYTITMTYDTKEAIGVGIIAAGVCTVGYLLLGPIGGSITSTAISTVATKI